MEESRLAVGIWFETALKESEGRNIYCNTLQICKFGQVTLFKF
jgi:hypothetical protein